MSLWLDCALDPEQPFLYVLFQPPNQQIYQTKDIILPPLKMKSLKNFHMQYLPLSTQPTPIF